MSKSLIANASQQTQQILQQVESRVQQLENEIKTAMQLNMHGCLLLMCTDLEKTSNPT
ncbi:hypothetical protein ACVLD2_000973 [Paenibacillus sp. PvR052]